MTRGRLLVGAAVAALFAVLGFLVGRATTGKAGGGAAVGMGRIPSAVTATVRTAPIARGTVSRTVEAFGIVAPGPGGARSVAVDYAAQVAAIYVRAGQAVTKGEKLLAVTASPKTGLAVDEARIEVAAAKRSLDTETRKHGLGLAAQASVDAAQAAWQAATARLKNLERQQAAVHRVIRAEAAGSVTKVPVSPGALVDAGTPLIVLTEAGRHEARLGLTAEVARRVKTGTDVALTAVLGLGAPVVGKVEAVDGSVDPMTGLVGIHVSLPKGSALLPGEAIRGRLAVARATGLVVPHSAVLPEDGKEVMFTVTGGHAVRHEVVVALASEKRLVVSAPGLAPGMQVVVLGNAELDDGMAVKVEGGR